MAKVTCAISGLALTVQHTEWLVVPHTNGYIHPIFSLEPKELHKLYIRHCKAQLGTTTDSYLLFLALLHSSNNIIWASPVSLNPTGLQTTVLIENNIAQLVNVLRETEAILHPKFVQPKFKVTYDNSDIAQIPNWIKAWRNNIRDFGEDIANWDEYEKLKKLTNKLTYLIKSTDSPESYAKVVADWAYKAGDFTEHLGIKQAILYRDTIANSFNQAKMFSTPLHLLKDIKDHCESYIEVGSIHFHTLIQTLNTGIKKHVDYLGGTASSSEYVLLPSLSLADKDTIQRNNAEISMIISTAPKDEPKLTDYDTSLAYLKAKLAYRVATSKAKNNIEKGDI
jgi:hypothetical protein